MTIKAARAKSLRKMDQQEANAYAMGGFVDESFSVDAVHQALEFIVDKVDLPAFDAFLGPRLGRYRAMSESQRDQPSIAHELNLVDETMEYVQQLRLRLEHLPSTTDAHLNSVCWNRRRELFHDFRLRLDSNLQEAWTLLVLAERELRPLKGKPGRKSSSLRDWLLSDVAHRLETKGCGKEAAAGAASAVLRAVGIDVPANSNEARKRIIAVEKLAGEISR